MRVSGWAWGCALVLAPGPCAAGDAYVVDPAASEVLTIQVGKAGLFKFAGPRARGHGADRATDGSRRIPADLSRSSVTLTFLASALRVTGKGDPPEDVPKVQEAMIGPKVLDASRFAHDRVHLAQGRREGRGRGRVRPAGRGRPRAARRDEGAHGSRADREGGGRNAHGHRARRPQADRLRHQVRCRSRASSTSGTSWTSPSASSRAPRPEQQLAFPARPIIAPPPRRRTSCQKVVSGPSRK